MSIPFEESRYLRGYSLGVGGVVLCGEKTLLVHSAPGRSSAYWAIPGGFVEPGETIDAAVQREVFEESGVRAKVEGVIGVRNRFTTGENSAYVIFLLRSDDEITLADGVEVDQAQYFNRSELEALADLNPLSRLVVTRVLEQQIKVLPFQAHPTYPPSEYVLYF